MLHPLFEKRSIFVFSTLVLLSFFACNSPAIETTVEKKEVTENPATATAPKPKIQKDFSRELYRGTAIRYDDKRQGKITASRAFYDANKFTAAVRENVIPIPLGTVIDVYDPTTKKRVRVKVNDRLSNRSVHIVKLSRVAAEAMGIKDDERLNVLVKAVKETETGVIEK